MENSNGLPDRRAVGEETVDSPRPTESSVSASGNSICRPRAGVLVEPAEGDSLQLSGEVQSLLQQRLRLAAIVVFAGLAGFLPYDVLQSNFLKRDDVILFGFHVVVVCAVGALAAVLWYRHLISERLLQAVHVGIFGLPVALFLAMQYFFTLESVRRGYFDFPDGPWLLVVFTYAVFIPNSVGRAAVVIGLLAALPLLLLLVMMAVYPEVAKVITVGELAQLVLLFALAAGGCIFGVNTVGMLRRQAFEARQLGRYRLSRRIGVGGMGEVYLAEHQLLKRPCVIKLIRPDKVGDAKVVARFEREVRATAKLSHWNTVEIYDYGRTEDGTFFYVMEYLPGMSLGELIDRYGPMPAERVIHLLRQACEALCEAHAAGLIHRDIKPGNIFAAHRGGTYDVVKLLDFGLVKPAGESESVHLTTEGAITGSPLYMSPEQALGDVEPDARSDIYALGAVGYYLLTGRPPFVADKPLKILFAHAHDPVVPPAQLRGDVPADLEQIILRCLAKSAADRFQDAASLSQALGDCEAAGRWSRADATRWWQQQEAEQAVPA